MKTAKSCSKRHEKETPGRAEEGESPGFTAKRRLSATKSRVPAAALTIRRLEAEPAAAHGGIAELRASAETDFLPDAPARALHLEATIDALGFSFGDDHVWAGASARKQERRAASR